MESFFNGSSVAIQEAYTNLEKGRFLVQISAIFGALIGFGCGIWQAAKPQEERKSTVGKFIQFGKTVVKETVK